VRIFAFWAITFFEQFLTITVGAQTSGLLFSTDKVIYFVCFFTKNGLGYNLGDFFTNSSGHLGFLQVRRFPGICPA
jgi:uncharacterized membrane-anchored protein